MIYNLHVSISGEKTEHNHGMPLNTKIQIAFIQPRIIQFLKWAAKGVDTLFLTVDPMLTHF